MSSLPGVFPEIQQKEAEIVDLRRSFSVSYVEARQKFLHACAQRGLTVQSHVHPLIGRDGEELALDVARSGPVDASQLLVVSSACHGIEGFSGSAVQIDLLRDDAWQTRCQRQGDLAVLYLHALNPYGFSWERRVTHENVDLNRNFRDFSQALTPNLDYLALAPALLPARCPPTWDSAARLMLYTLRHGRPTLQSAISRGQHDDAAGLFFAGHAPTWSNQRVRQILQEQAQHCQRIGWIDIHTGLGPSGFGERIYQGPSNAESLARARAWWGPKVTSYDDGSSSSSALTGTMIQAVMADCPQAQYNGLALEFGTLAGTQVLSALRAEQWLENHPETDAVLRKKIKQKLRNAFYVETDAWKQLVLAQARDVAHATLLGLSTPW